MEEPWLVQRCKLGGGELRFNHMGFREFSDGEQVKSYKRIFEKGMVSGSTVVNICNKVVVVFMVAGMGFDFTAYQQYLQRLVNGELRLRSPIYFEDAVMSETGIKPDPQLVRLVDVWFDFQNDVLWTLTRDNLEVLVSTMLSIKHWFPSKK